MSLLFWRGTSGGGISELEDAGAAGAAAAAAATAGLCCGAALKGTGAGKLNWNGLSMSSGANSSTKAPVQPGGYCTVVHTCRCCVGFVFF